jgi:hypothetical protein
MGPLLANDSVGRMEWTAEVDAGDWLRERIDDPWRGTMHDVVPRGFPAYARVFHPATRDRPVGAAWPTEPYSDRRAWDAFHSAHPDLVVDNERVTWAATAAALGRTMHAGAQWAAIARFDPRANRENDPRDAAGWRYSDPEQGGMPPDVVAALADVLVRHTSAPRDGWAALWEGHGDLVGHFGVGPSRVFFQVEDADGPADPDLAQHNAMLGRSLKDRFNSVFRKPTWQDGILPRDVSEGARLRLPGRDYVLFRGDVSELAHPEWVLHVPWRDRESEEHGLPPSAHAPGILWPADRAWVSVTEVDFDSTIVGGTDELIRALCADPRLEALPIRAGADLSWDADEVNR